MDDIFKLIEGQDVFIFGTGLEINELLLDPFNLEVISNTALNPLYLDHPTNCVFGDLQVQLDERKKKKLIKAYNKAGFNNFLTMGYNLFSCYFPCDVAFFADSGAEWPTREILKNSTAKYLITTKKCKEFNLPFTERITHTFEWSGGEYKKGLIDTKYKGQLWWWRTGILGLLHLAALGKAKRIFLTGVAWNPLEANHFYEDYNENKTFGWVNKEVVEITKKFPKLFPDTKFYKTSVDSFVPFPYIDINEVLNGKL